MTYFNSTEKRSDIREYTPFTLKYNASNRNETMIPKMDPRVRVFDK